MLKEKENKIMGITMVLSLLSGVALFLYGMSLMGDSLKKVAGNKLELILYRLTNTPLKGLLLGTVVTAIIQSSSATTVMVVGFVNSGMMKEAEAGDRYHHGCQHRNQYHRMDPMSLLH